MLFCNSFVTKIEKQKELLAKSKAKYEADKSAPGSKILSKLAIALHVSQDVLTGIGDDISEGDREIWELREQVRRDPERQYLFDLARNANIDDVRQAVAIIDALKSTRK